MIIIMGVVIVAATMAVTIIKPKSTLPEETFEKALQELELTGIKGIGSKRAEELKVVGVNSIFGPSNVLS